MGSANRNVNVYGIAEVDVTTDGSTYNELGTTRDGVQLTTDGYFLDVKNDENGGEAGPPVEIQYLGETARIRCELTKYDAVVAGTLEDHFANVGAVGTPAAAGTLMFASAYGTNQVYTTLGGAVGIKINGASTNSAGSPAPIVRTFARCVIHDAVEVNRGTKFSTYVIVFTAYKDASGHLWVDGAS